MKCFFIFKKSIILLTITCLVILFYNMSFSTNNNLDYTIPELQYTLNELYDSTEKVAYLTFDDGPSTKETEKILDILNKENIKATFFVIGKKVKEQPNIVKRTYEEGHYIANHGYSHNNSELYKNSQTFISEIKNTDLEISKAIGVDNYHSQIFRFPNGYIAPIYKSQKKQMLTELYKIGYSYIDWNCLNKDSEIKYSNSQLLNNLKQSCKNKNTLVILMHDTGDVNNSSEVLLDSITYLKNEGYTFKNFYEQIQ